MAATKELNVERWSALAISTATIGTAWRAFQASVWSGRQAFLLAGSALVTVGLVAIARLPKVF
ncbi:MAG: hypothetical protein GX591_16245 [Planctomycetes bacterium]|nr:hypothetical protein [Planctomycetota bacterium]